MVRLVFLAAAILSLGVLAAAADAYYQSFKIYRDVREVLPNLRQASDHLARGQLPPGDPFGKADLAVRRAGEAVDRARFTLRLTGTLPFLGRPVDAVRHGVTAAGEVTQATLIAQAAVTDLLGDAASTRESVPASETPLYQGGVVNLKLLGALGPRLQEIISHLRVAEREIRAIPSIPYFSDVARVRDRASSDARRAIGLAERALTGTRLLPRFFGAEERRNYFVALQNNADLRGTGGGVLAYAIVSADRGKLQLIHGGDALAIRLRPETGNILVPLPPELRWYIQNVPHAFSWINGVNYTPNFPLVAEAWARMASRVTGIRIDGVIEMDSPAVARLLGSRKIRVPAFPRAITGRNLVKVVSHDQYFLPNAEQIAFPVQLIAAAWPKMLDPGPLQTVLRDLGESLREKRIQLWSADPDLQRRLGQLGWNGAVRAGGGDYLYVADNKIVSNKVDYYSRVSVNYDVRIDPSGDARGELEVTLTNTTPPGLPRRITGAPERTGGYAVNRALMLAFVPGQAKLEQANPEDGLPDHIEAGAKVFARTIQADAGKAATMRLRYNIPGVVTSSGDHRVYRLTIQRQPLIAPADLTVTVTLPNGSTVRSAPPGWTIRGNVLTLKTNLTHDMVHEIVF